MSRNFPKSYVLALAAAGLLFSTTAAASLLDFSHQTGPRGWDDYNTGMTWTFTDVQTDVDMTLTLDSLTPDTQLKIHPLGDQLKITLKGRSGADRLATFSASFYDTTIGEKVTVAPHFLLTDIDHGGNNFTETAWFDHVETYSLTEDTHLDTSIAGDVVTTTGTWLNTNGSDDRAWLGLQLAATTDFQFGWGFRGLQDGKGGMRQRGLEFGGTAEVDFDRGQQTPVPEPTSLALLALGGVLLRRR